MAEKSLSARHRRELLAEYGFESITLGEVVIAGASAVRIDVTNRFGFDSRAMQSALHSLGRTRALWMRGSGVMGITACAPAGEPRQDRRATFSRVFFRLEHDHCRPFSEAHARSPRIEWAASGRIHQQQRMKASPGHTANRIRAAGKHKVSLPGED